ncbi:MULTISPECIES: cytochrome o ubiquinol oxidase subunit IV [Priestia]|uniref:cytochrome o ubiquinol oxidase subunit IV n=1 Tax=Priestia TaxID=2800373 RepID=UPI000BEB8F17|nr:MULTISPECIES: cytochrome o ubiquinol oxidase subunit IV [Priestia]MDC0703300.1 cytochrome o ubiquinol oxidase subunit IV [Priestia sp. AB]MDW4509652.1 cytochrome o ubiquinol oxidase subunit IV [Priestia megaterium]MED4208994.1 cytochrome o ubiquinol oxidase subunit IV [Priestia megaterium]PEC45106.1 cytochrome o ubiquinol oxidase subunit IV [Priestia megaterium]
MENHGSLKAYTIGFIFSIILTVIPLMLVLNQVFAKNILLASILGMAVLQFFIQLFFFMHIKDGEKPRYNVMALILGIVFVITIVAGSIWIMTFNSQVQ